jgi:hypothetical protein
MTHNVHHLKLDEPRRKTGKAVGFSLSVFVAQREVAHSSQGRAKGRYTTAIVRSERFRRYLFNAAGLPSTYNTR